MRFKLGILYLFTFSLMGQEITRDLPYYLQRNWHEMNREEVKHYLHLKKDRSKNAASFNMILAKQSILSGDYERARIYLNRVNDNDDRFKLIKKRYLSLMSFIERDYQTSLELLNDPRMEDNIKYRHICLQKLINYTALKKKKQFQAEIRKCKEAILTDKRGDHNFFWLDQYYLLTTKPDSILNEDYMKNFKSNDLKSGFITRWLKLALFLNKEQDIINMLPRLPEEAYLSQKNRELIGFAYYRLGNKKMTKEFIEDIESPNADNIRGNMSLDESRYELAFGHFQLALKKKKNSINALRRSIPLAWQLGQWEKAQELLSQLHEEHIDPRKKIALMAALQLKSQNYFFAERNLKILDKEFKEDSPIEIDLMSSYVALRRFEAEELTESSDRACQKYDGLNCYLYLQTLTWNNLGETLARQDPMPTQKLDQFDVDQLKKPVSISKLSEAKYVDQKDIEELDGRTLHLRLSQ